MGWDIFNFVNFENLFYLKPYSLLILTKNTKKSKNKKSKNSEKNKIMIWGMHYFITKLKTKIDVIPRSCFNQKEGMINSQYYVHLGHQNKTNISCCHHHAVKSPKISLGKYCSLNLKKGMTNSHYYCVHVAGIIGTTIILFKLHAILFNAQ